MFQKYIELFSSLGKEIAELVNEFEEPWKYSYYFDSQNRTEFFYVDYFINNQWEQRDV